MIRPVFAYLCAFHYGGVVLASYGWIGTVYPLPYPMDWLELGIIGSYAWRTYENTKQRPLSLVGSQRTFSGTPVRALDNAQIAGVAP